MKIHCVVCPVDLECRLGNAGAQIACQFGGPINFDPSAGEFNAQTLCTRVIVGDENQIQALYGASCT